MAIRDTSAGNPTLDDHLIRLSDLSDYEPAITKATGFNLATGTTAGTLAIGDHNHDATYAALTHDHNSDYYTQAQIDTQAAGYATDTQGGTADTALQPVVPAIAGNLAALDASGNIIDAGAIGTTVQAHAAVLDATDASFTATKDTELTDLRADYDTLAVLVGFAIDDVVDFRDAAHTVTADDFGRVLLVSHNVTLPLAFETTDVLRRIRIWAIGAAVSIVNESGSVTVAGDVTVAANEFAEVFVNSTDDPITVTTWQSANYGAAGGGGDVSASVTTPTVGQFAVWTDGTTVEGQAVATVQGTLVTAGAVTTAGAVMDTGWTDLADVKTLSVPATTTISPFGATIVDDADGPAVLSTLGVTVAASVLNNTSGTNSGNDAVNINYADDYRLGNFVAGTDYEPAITKATAFNKAFGTAAGTVAQGDDSRIVGALQINPALGTPVSGAATNLTGTAASLTAGTATVANAIKSATTSVSTSAAAAPTTGQRLTATSSTTATWQTPTVYQTTALTSAQMLVGNGSNVATAVAVTGDVALSNAGAIMIVADKVVTAKILNNNVTLPKLAQVATATMLGRTTAATGNVEALTVAQARGVLGIPATAPIATKSFWTGTQAAYTALGTWDANTLYFVSA